MITQFGHDGREFLIKAASNDHAGKQITEASFEFFGWWGGVVKEVFWLELLIPS